MPSMNMNFPLRSAVLSLAMLLIALGGQCSASLFAIRDGNRHQAEDALIACYQHRETETSASPSPASPRDEDRDEDVLSLMLQINGQGPAMSWAGNAGVGGSHAWCVAGGTEIISASLVCAGKLYLNETLHLPIAPIRGLLKIPICS